VPYFELSISSLKILYSIENPSDVIHKANTSSRAFSYATSNSERRKSLCLTLINDSAEEIQISNIKEKSD